jgi:hypothetical protein
MIGGESSCAIKAGIFMSHLEADVGMKWGKYGMLCSEDCNLIVSS